jgi:hypothetical protein
VTIKHILVVPYAISAVLLAAIFTTILAVEWLLAAPRVKK